MTSALAIGHSRQHIDALQAVAMAAQNDARLRGGNWRAHQATLHGVDVVCFRIASSASESVLTVCPDGAVTPRSETEVQALIAKGAEIDFSAPITPKPWQANRDLFADPEPAPAAPPRGPANLDALLAHANTTHDTAIRNAITANSLGGEDIAHAVLRLHNYATSAESGNRPNNALIRRARQELASYLRGEMPVITQLIAAERRGEWDPLRAVLGYLAAGQTAPGRSASSPPGDLISNDETASEKIEIPPGGGSEFSPERCLRDRGLTLPTLSTEDLTALLDNLGAAARYDFAEWLLPRRYDLRPVVDEILTEHSHFDREVEPRADFYYQHLIKQDERDAAEAQFERDGIVGFEVGEHRLACIHPSAKQPGHFQVTSYDHLGTIGDQQYATLQDAVSDLVLVSKGRPLPFATARARLEKLAASGIVNSEKAASLYDSLPADLTTLTSLARYQAEQRLADDHTATEAAFHAACHIIVHLSDMEGANPVRDALRGASRVQSRDWLCNLVERVGLAPALAYHDAVKETAVQALDPSAPQERRTDTTLTVSASKSAGKSRRHARLPAFGEKIGGSRKEQAQYRQKLSNPLPEDLKRITLSNHFPEPNYEKLIETGYAPLTVALVKVCRDEVPAKPRNAYKLRRWRDQLDQMRQITAHLLEDPAFAHRLIEGMKTHKTLANLSDRAELLLALGFPRVKNLRGFRIEQNSGITRFRGQSFPPPGVTRYVVKQNSTLLSLHTTWEEALVNIEQRLQQSGTTARQPNLDIWQVPGGEIVIGKKVAAGKYLDLQGGFTSARAAREYLATHREALLAQLAERKQKPGFRQDENREREGPDYRNGKDVTGEQMMETFGFRGGDYGGYVEYKSQQWHLNQSYDALMDLARLLNISPQAIALNRDLGIGYGARGRGRANARYIDKERVIDLTKERGPGSLAHEWFHALDFRLAAHAGITGPLSESSQRPEVAARFNGSPETLKAFRAIGDAIRTSGLPERCRILDVTRTKDYFGTMREMAARCFEHYLHTQLQALGQHSDYLVNISDNGDDERSPFPHSNEVAAIHGAFNHLFTTLQEKTADKGVTLFRLGNRLPAIGETALTSQLDVNRLINDFREQTQIPVEMVWDVSDLPAGAREKVMGVETDLTTVQGVYWNDKVYVVHRAHRDANDVLKTLMHDGIAHYGLRQVFGQHRVDHLMDDIYLGLNEQQRAAVMTLAARAQLNMTDLQQRRRATEEYVAHVAEQGLEQTLLQRVVGHVRQWMRETPWLRTLTSGYSDNDITSLLARVDRQLRTTPTPRHKPDDPPAMPMAGQATSSPAALARTSIVNLADRRAAWTQTDSRNFAAADTESSRARLPMG